MKARIGCIPCFVKQGLSAVRLATQDPALQRKALDEILRRVQGISLDASPAHLSNIVYAITREVTAVADPFEKAKRDTNRLALALLPEIRTKIAASSDPFHAAIKVALVGNVIDLGIGHKFDMEIDIGRALAEEMTVDDYPAFLERLAACGKLLYICDNSGEIAFDRLLIELLAKRCSVTASVKSGPIINDATMRDAEEVGLTSIVPVIETGSDYIGVNWEKSSPEFIEAYRSADLIIAKGQGNYETLSDSPGEIFFLLKVKCPEVADEIGHPEGSSIFMRKKL